MTVAAFLMCGGSEFQIIYRVGVQETGASTGAERS